MRFNDKVVVITGACGEIGKCIVESFMNEGALVVACDINERALQAINDNKDFNDKIVITEKVDITNEKEVVLTIEKITRDFGRIDILVNNAGIVRDRVITEMTEKEWDDVLDVNLKGAFFFCKHVARQMLIDGKGKIVNISSRAYLGNPGQANYSSSKAGLIGLTKSLAKELGPAGINVNAIAPGLIETDMIISHPKYEKIKNIHIKLSPLKRLGKVTDVRDAVLFMSSEESSYITGEILHVTGGRMG
ncbi:MAG: 3-oxoacyl-ACP reductase FabG [Eubacteriales bacterium]|nr:3-oxoacyl-ACP reductase FabG [Eubacteriales bacterium]